MTDPAPRQRPGFFHAVGMVSAAVASSRITGLLREMVMSRLFGAGAVNDAFQVGFRIPNLTRNLFAEGALSSAFVPTLTQYLTTKGRREAAELSDLVATALVLVVGTVCAVGMIFSPQLVRLMAPGFERVPGKFELAVLLTRIMFPFLLTVALAAQAMGVLNACDRYGVPALASSCFNVGSVLVGLAVGLTVGRNFHQGLIVSMACGVLAGGVLQWLWQVPGMRREGFRWRPRLDFQHPGLGQIARLMLPAVLGSAAVQINILVNTNLASRITDGAGHVIDGPVSWLGYAFRFLQLPLGLFGVAIASATLPAVSRSAAARRIDELRDTLARSLGMVLLLTIPSSAGLAVLGESMIGLVYQGGHFGAWDTHQTAVALTCYSLGLAGYAAAKILGPAFYALDDARTPALVSVSSVAVNLPLALALLKWTGMGHAGLALATSLAALLSAAALFAVLRARIGGIHGRRLAVSAGKIAAASALMSVLCKASSVAVHLAAGVGRTAQLADVAISIPLGVSVFYAAARALGVGELEALRSACYTSIRNAARSEVGDPPPGN
ncbi:MAG TPA: murein biosynthesis integral membrane protein MurJ [Bryobacteraceae bacterium]|nr:murein biosynthesis integral membrane protein MurJ [Bryobacteraceae bacterium]